MNLNDYLRYRGFDPLEEGRSVTWVTPNLLVFIKTPLPDQTPDEYQEFLESSLQVEVTVICHEIPDPVLEVVKAIFPDSDFNHLNHPHHHDIWAVSLSSPDHFQLIPSETEHDHS